jgi:hypothetical protein
MSIEADLGRDDPKTMEFKQGFKFSFKERETRSDGY